MGDPPVSQIAFTFTALGLLNALLLWPVVLALYLTGAENLTSDSIPWNILLAASLLLLGTTGQGWAVLAQVVMKTETFIAVTNFHCSFPHIDAVQRCRYL